MIPQQMRFDDISEEYAAFVDKFKPKKTTDDCYTPEPVYEAIAGWVAEEYHLDRENFVRPFYPGGDYERYPYTDDSVVVDNPPFSIITPITEFYERHGVRYFLFAPYLTVLGIRSATCRIVVDMDITYSNGAKVATSYITNLERTLVRTAPELARRIDKVQREARPPEKPKYSYPHDVITSTIVGYIGKYGVDYKLMPEDAIFIRSMDAQRKHGKSLFGGGYLLSEKAAAEKAAAEKAAAEKAAAEKAAEKEYTFQLSERERELQRQMGRETQWRDLTASSEAVQPGSSERSPDL